MSIGDEIARLHLRYDATEAKVDRAVTWAVATGVTSIIVGAVLIVVFVLGVRIG